MTFRKEIVLENQSNISDRKVIDEKKINKTTY